MTRPDYEDLIVTGVCGISTGILIMSVVVWSAILFGG